MYDVISFNWIVQICGSEAVGHTRIPIIEGDQDS